VGDWGATLAAPSLFSAAANLSNVGKKNLVKIGNQQIKSVLKRKTF
jgi:hypothetical protein